MLMPRNTIKIRLAPKATAPASPTELLSAFKPRPMNSLNYNNNNLGVGVKVGPATRVTGA
jgi:hypothetical protein